MHRILFAIFLALWGSSVQAAAIPAYTGRVNNSIGSIVQQKVGKWGFAANDPRFGATVNAIGTAATTVAAGVATGAVATVGWPALLVGAGVSAVVGGAVSLGLDGLIKWLWPDSNHPAQTQVSGTGMGVGDPKNFPVIPGTYPAILDAYGGGADIWYANDTNYTRARHIRTVQVICPGGDANFCSGSSANSAAMDYTFSSTYSGPFPGANGYYSNAYRRQISSTSNPATYTYQILYDFTPPSGTTLLPPSYTPKWQASGQSVNDLPQGYVTQPLSDEQLAAVANTLWKKAASANNPDAIPWSPTDPITPADIASWRANNQQLVPTVNDFISPVAPPGATSVPIPNPGTDGPPVNPPGTQPTTTASPIDWGTFTPPTLEDTPTTASILDPIFNMWPQWNNYAFPSHSAECPKPTFVALGHTFTFDHMCTWTEMVRPAVQAAFALIWALMVIFIVMGA
jgi:hypothetical protein